MQNSKGSSSAMTTFRRMLDSHLQIANVQKGKTRAMVLALIFEAHPKEIAQRELVAHGQSGSAVHEALTELEDMGLVQRRRDPDDARIELARLTKRGERALRSMLDYTAPH
jgi:DNA-binding MarR family transcriptional regulator